MIGIINIGSGNIGSVKRMLDYLNKTSVIVDKASELTNCDKLILPGMGSFDRCAELLEDSGMRPILEKEVLENKKPFLGICVGMQLLMRGSEEGVKSGLNWIAGDTVAFNQELMGISRPIPNIGWLDIELIKPSQMNEGLNEARFYFAHSYHVKLDKPENNWINAYYGYEFPVGIYRDNIFGVQFHPEKSHRFGMQLLKNFSALTL